MPVKLDARTLAKANNNKTYMSDSPCKRGHVSLRYTKSKVCLSCEKERGVKRRATNKYKISQQIYREKNKVRLKAYMQIWHYGITSDELIKLQDGKCAICKCALDLAKRTHIDHKGNKVRGVLCHLCNVGLGHFRDSVEFLQNAIDYLEMNKKST